MMGVMGPRQGRMGFDIANFVSTHAEVRDIRQLPACERILIVGSGPALDAPVFLWLGFRVVTMDREMSHRPDVVGDVSDMGMFADGQFDVVVASHVVEHLPEARLDRCLSEIARVGRFALVYLPVHGIHGQVRLRSSFRDLDLQITWDVRKPWRRPAQDRPLFMEGQHYWEIGVRGYRLPAVRRRLEKEFVVISEYRNRDWLPSYNFVLRSRRGVATEQR